MTGAKLTRDEGYQKVEINGELELDGEVLTSLCIIREKTNTVIVIFPRGTEYRDVKEVFLKTAGLRIGLVKVRATYEILEEAKSFPPDRKP